MSEPRSVTSNQQCSCPTCGAKYDAGPTGQSLEARSLEARKDVIRKALGEIERFFGLAPSAPETTDDDALLCEQCTSEDPLKAAVCLDCWNKLAIEVKTLRRSAQEMGALQTDRDCLVLLLGNLVRRVDEIHADPAFQSVWVVNQLHVGPYTGPKYEEQMESARLYLNNREVPKPSAVETSRDLTLQDFGYTPGNYTFTCLDCAQPSVGDKRALRCEVCAAKALGAIESSPCEIG